MIRQATVFYLTCDGCDNPISQGKIELDFETPGEAVQEMSRQGWAQTKGRGTRLLHYCKNCFTRDAKGSVIPTWKPEPEEQQ